MSTKRYFRRNIILPAVLILAVAVVFFAQVLMQPREPTTLTWVRPVATESDVPIDNIAGYTVRCWAYGGSKTHTIRLDDPAVTHYELDRLPSGRYKCAVSAFTDDGIESDMSSFVARTVK